MRDDAISREPPGPGRFAFACLPEKGRATISCPCKHTDDRCPCDPRSGSIASSFPVEYRRKRLKDDNGDPRSCDGKFNLQTPNLREMPTCKFQQPKTL